VSFQDKNEVGDQMVVLTPDSHRSMILTFLTYLYLSDNLILRCSGNCIKRENREQNDYFLRLL
jgi:hypothetical protein